MHTTSHQFELPRAQFLLGDCLSVLQCIPDCSVDACVTSPPYWQLRDYGSPSQVWGAWTGSLGREPTPQLYVEHLVAVFNEVRRVLKDDGSLWLIMGDSFAHASSDTLKANDLVGIPWQVAFALRDAGWFLRSDMVWSKPNPLPESVIDRPTRAHEFVFLLTKQPRYFYDHRAIAEPVVPATAKLLQSREIYGNRNGSRRPVHLRGRGLPTTWNPILHTNDSTSAPMLLRRKRSVWTVTTLPFRGEHRATFPPELIRSCIRAGCPPGGTILDPFLGAGTTALVALEESRSVIGIELNEKYLALAKARTAHLLPDCKTE